MELPGEATLYFTSELHLFTIYTLIRPPSPSTEVKAELMRSAHTNSAEIDKVLMIFFIRVGFWLLKSNDLDVKRLIMIRLKLLTANPFDKFP